MASEAETGAEVFECKSSPSDTSSSYAVKCMREVEVDLNVISEFDEEVQNQYSFLIDQSTEDSSPGKVFYYPGKSGQYLLLNRLQPQIAEIKDYGHGPLPLLSFFSAHPMDVSCNFCPFKLKTTCETEIAVYADINSIQLITTELVVVANVLGSIITADAHKLDYVYGVSIYPYKESGEKASEKYMQKFSSDAHKLEEQLMPQIESMYKQRKEKEFNLKASE